MDKEHEQDHLKNEVTRYLSARTRGGMYAPNNQRQVVQLREETALDAALVESVIEAQSPKSLVTLINTLYKERVDISSLEPSALLKLRATLLLGLGEARHLASEERREALARTYRRHVPLGTAAPRGANQFRDQYREMKRVEREDLLARIATLVVEELNKAPTPIPTVGSKLPWDFEVEEARDEYVYPAKADGETFTVIRTRTVRSTVPALTEYRQTYTDRSPGGALPIVQNIGQGELRVEHLRTYEEDGTPGYRYDVVISFPPVPRGESIDIAWMLTHRFTAENQWKPGHMRFARITPVTAIGKLTIGVRFTAPEMPTEIWRLDNISPQNALETSSRGAALDIVQGRAEASWENLVLGRTCGIVWCWPGGLELN